jgi:hypothetical protein
VTFTLMRDGLKIDYEATTDKATPVNRAREGGVPQDRGGVRWPW